VRAVGGALRALGCARIPLDPTSITDLDLYRWWSHRPLVLFGGRERHETWFPRVRLELCARDRNEANEPEPGHHEERRNDRAAGAQGQRARSHRFGAAGSAAAFDGSTRRPRSRVRLLPQRPEMRGVSTSQPRGVVRRAEPTTHLGDTRAERRDVRSNGQGVRTSKEGR